MSMASKMSKSYGNVIDPLTVMDELGTDALRFTLLVGSTPGNDMNLSIKKVEANRNFANKMWNATRFVLSAIQGVEHSERNSPGDPAASVWTLADSWIWSRLQTLVREVNRLFESYQFGEAGRQIYDFFWAEFADWYLEIAKGQLEMGGDRARSTAETLARVLDISLRLLHPFVPFVTEELWGFLKAGLAATNLDHRLDAPALIIAKWPEPRPEEAWEPQKTADFSLIQELVRAVRNLRSEKGVKPGKKVPAILVTVERISLLHEQAGVIAALAGLELADLKVAASLPSKPEGHIAAGRRSGGDLSAAGGPGGCGRGALAPAERSWRSRGSNRAPGHIAGWFLCRKSAPCCGAKGKGQAGCLPPNR